MKESAPMQSIHLTEYYYILNKHRSLIMASLLIIVSLTLLLTFLLKPVYRATATMVIDKEQTASPLTGERLDFESYISQSLTFNTHFELITSRPVMERLIRELKLDQMGSEAHMSIGLLQAFVSQFKKNIRLLLRNEAEPLSAEEELTRLIQELRTKINIDPVRDTRLLKVNVEDHDPVLARNIANTLAKVYIKYNVENRLKSSQTTLSSMTDQLYDMKKNLESAEQEFLAFKQQEQLFSITGKQKVIEQKIEDFNDAYLAARNKRLELDAKLKELNRIVQSKENVLHARSLIGNAVLDNLYSQLLDSEVELTRLSKVFKSKHPKMIQLRTKIDKTRKKLREELIKEIDTLKAERSVLASRENVLQKTTSDFENDALETNSKELQYSIHKRNVDTNQKLYDTLLSKVKESNLMGNLDVSNIRIAEEAPLPVNPIKPKKKLNVILSIVLGLLTGIGLSFFWDYLDRSLRTEEDIERYLALPVLSVVPLVQAPEGKA